MGKSQEGRLCASERHEQAISFQSGLAQGTY